jgi:hypothetical protein
VDRNDQFRHSRHAPGLTRRCRGVVPWFAPDHGMNIAHFVHVVLATPAPDRVNCGAADLTRRGSKWLLLIP